MSKDITVRLVTPAGRSRIVLPATATYGDLQQQVKDRTGVDIKDQRFALDPKGAQPVSSASTSPLSVAGIANGTQLHLVNKDASIAAQILTKQPVSVEPEQPVTREGNTGAAQSSAASSSSPSTAAAASSSSGGASGSAGSTSVPAVEDGKKADPKIETFDAFLRNRRYDTAALPGSQKYLTGVVKQGGMIKIPPSVSIKQQPYRHVDTLSVMNVPEMEYFIGYWMNNLLENGMQRLGWMYGYYLEDKYYDEGCRAVLEAIYEPPQEMVGEMARPMTDPHEARVKRIADALGLEPIGWIFTSLLLDDGLLLSPQEVLQIARLQLDHSTDIHFTKYSLSKYVSCAVRPDVKLGGLPNINPFMVSDQCVAMVRDGIMAECSDRTACEVRDAKSNELIPSFIVEGKPSKKILTDFFVVRVNDTTPKKVRSMFAHSDFPRENRQTHPQRRDDLKKYFKKRDKSEPSWAQFADFHLLLYIAQEIDVDTAVAICECVRDRKEIPEGVQIIVNSLVQ